MTTLSPLACIKKLRRPVFTTHDISALSGRSLSATTQALNFLLKQGVIIKVYRGVWADSGADKISPYQVVPFLFPRHRAYVSFISALHLYGMIEQIPQMITLASTAHTKIIKTALGNFSVHQITPSFFKGFDWYKGTGSFLIAAPEKALVDCLYLSSYKKKRFGFFPELDLPRTFKIKKAREWAKMIKSPKARASVQEKLESILAP